MTESDGLRRPLAEMEPIAIALRDELAPFCERIEIAGSIRRRRPDIGDIELICVPSFGTVKRGLFPERGNLLDWYYFIARASDWRPRLDKNERQAIGYRFKRLSVDGVPLDLFSVLPPAQWGLILLIRTGPADYSHRLVTPRLQGGWLPSHLRVVHGGIYDGDELLPTAEETDVYKILGLPWEAPEARR